MFTSAWDGGRTTLDCSSALLSQWIQLINNLLNFPIVKKHVGVQINPLNILCSGQHLRCFGSTLIDKKKKKRSTSIFIASILHGHFEFFAAGLPFEGDASVTPFCNHSACWPETCEREWRNSVARWRLTSVCVCTRVWFSCVNLCRCLLVVSAGLLGKDQPKEWFFYNKKKKSRIGLDEIDIFIRKKKIMHTFFEWKSFFLERNIPVCCYF